jgi:hypothetical protein
VSEARGAKRPTVAGLGGREYGLLADREGGAVKKIIGAVVMAAGLLILSAGPASAHYTSIYHGSDNAWVYSSHLRVGVDDNECDGHYVYVVWIDPFSKAHWVYNKGGCGSLAVVVDTPELISQYQLCEYSVSCTSWKIT